LASINAALDIGVAGAGIVLDPTEMHSEAALPEMDTGFTDALP